MNQSRAHEAVETTANNGQVLKKRLHVSRDQIHTLSQVSGKSIKSNPSNIQTPVEECRSSNRKRTISELQHRSCDSNIGQMHCLQSLHNFRCHGDIKHLASLFRTSSLLCRLHGRSPILPVSPGTKSWGIKSDVEVNSDVCTQHQHTAEKFRFSAKAGLLERPAKDQISRDHKLE